MPVDMPDKAAAIETVIGRVATVVVWSVGQTDGIHHQIVHLAFGSNVLPVGHCAASGKQQAKGKEQQLFHVRNVR